MREQATCARQDAAEVDKPLAGVRALDFGQYVAGPAAAMMLADQGADVVRVDPPGGPMWSTPANAMLNRGKRSIVLNLKGTDDADAARRLVASADVMIENFRPGVMERLGLGPEAMTSLNPRLVYLSLPGFSRCDERRGLQAWEGVVASAVGMYMDMGMNRRLRGLVPSYTPLPVASAYAASLGALAVSVALLARARHGCGDIIEVPLASAVLEGLVFNGMHIDNLPERYLSLREREMERRTLASEPMDMSLEQLDKLLDPFYQNYFCKDGRPFYVCCSGHGGHVRRLLEAFDLWELLKAEGLPTEDPYLSTREWAPGTECTINAYPLSQGWTDRIRELLREAFAKKTSSEWEEFFAEHDVPGAAQRTCEEWLSAPHALESALVVAVNDSRYGSMKQAGVHVWLEGLRDQYAHLAPAHALDADREEILGSLPQSDDMGVLSELKRLDQRERERDTESLPLANVRILDLTNVIAGPTIGAMLARFGADVIKIDPPRPTFDPTCTVIFGLSTGRGKRSLLLDLGQPEGQEALRRLVETADAVLFNGVNRQLKHLGLDLETLKKFNPQIVLCQFSAYGGPTPGPLSEHLGYDDLVQASTGIMTRFGGSLDTPEEHAHVGTIDVLAGFIGAYAVVLGLLERDRSNQPVQVYTSLAAAGQLLQAPFMYDFPGRLPFDEPSGPYVKGEHALYRLYEAADGWLFLGGWCRERLADLAAIPELADIESTAEDSDDDAALVSWLEKRLKLRPVAYWESQLRNLDVGAQAVSSIADVRGANLTDEEDGVPDIWRSTVVFVRHSRHESGHGVDLVAPNGIRMSRQPTRLPGSAPKYGRDTVSILGELGYTREEVQTLLDKHVVSSCWSDQYLPD